MIFEKKFSEKTYRRLSRLEQKANGLTQPSVSVDALYQQFKARYARQFVLAMLIPLILFAVPCVYFLMQNYEIFIGLAYDLRPDLLIHMEREKSLLLALVGMTILGSAGFCYLVTLRMIRAVIGPIWAIERHMKRVTLGDWSAEDYRLRSSDDFQSLSATYSYLYRMLRSSALKELEYLESLKIDPANRHDHTVVEKMIDLKRAQMGIVREDVNGGSAGEIFSSPSQRRAS
jgi:hypothetical protein